MSPPPYMSVRIVPVKLAINPISLTRLLPVGTQVVLLTTESSENLLLCRSKIGELGQLSQVDFFGLINIPFTTWHVNRGKIRVCISRVKLSTPMCFVLTPLGKVIKGIKLDRSYGSQYLMMLQSSPCPCWLEWIRPLDCLRWSTNENPAVALSSWAYADHFRKEQNS